jgi:nitric oxide reductase subunit C
VNLVGPSLAGIPATAAARIKSAEYHGKATDAAGYIRESILEPNAHVVAGPTYSSNGQSMMPATFGRTLKSAQVDALVAYLMTLK